MDLVQIFSQFIIICEWRTAYGICGTTLMIIVGASNLALAQIHLNLLKWISLACTVYSVQLWIRLRRRKPLAPHMHTFYVHRVPSEPTLKNYGGAIFHAAAAAARQWESVLSGTMRGCDLLFAKNNEKKRIERWLGVAFALLMSRSVTRRWKISYSRRWRVARIMICTHMITIINNLKELRSWISIDATPFIPK